MRQDKQICGSYEDFYGWNTFLRNTKPWELLTGLGIIILK